MCQALHLKDAVICPPGHFKRNEQEIRMGCESADIDCFGHRCLCSPCVAGFEVDFFPAREGSSSRRKGCDKFAICGNIEQADTITFRAIDNKARRKAFSANVLIGNQVERYNMQPMNSSSFNGHELVFDATL